MRPRIESCWERPASGGGARGGIYPQGAMFSRPLTMQIMCPRGEFPRVAAQVAKGEVAALLQERAAARHFSAEELRDLFRHGALQPCPGVPNGHCPVGKVACKVALPWAAKRPPPCG